MTNNRQEMEKELREEYDKFYEELDPTEYNEPKIVDWFIEKLSQELNSFKEKVIKEVGKIKVDEEHTKDCAYKTYECNCGKLERAIFNKAIDDIINLIILK